MFYVSMPKINHLLDLKRLKKAELMIFWFIEIEKHSKNLLILAEMKFN